MERLAARAGGEPVRGGRRLQLEETATRRGLNVLVDVEGRFRVALEPGRWAVRAMGAGGVPPSELAVIEVREADLERDVRLTGATLRGRLLGPIAPVAPIAADAASSGVAGARVAVRPQGGAYAYLSAPVSPGGDFELHGLQPGRWTLTAEPHPLDTPDGELGLEVGPECDDVRIEAGVRGP